MNTSKKSHLSVVVIGDVDSGKSTIVGYLLSKSENFDDSILEIYDKESQKFGKGSAKYAWVSDRLTEERKRGLTIITSINKIETDKKIITLLDNPGHRDFMKNIITGMSQADVALLVVSARRGEFETGMVHSTREHALLARAMGVQQIIVAINKMDAPEIQYSKEKYFEVRKEVGDMLKIIGYSQIGFIPMSAINGENLFTRCEKMKRFDGFQIKNRNHQIVTGNTLMDALDIIEPKRELSKKPLRVPVMKVHNIEGTGTVVIGRILSGTLRTGMTLRFSPGKLVSSVASIQIHGKQTDLATAGDIVGINVPDVPASAIRRGFMCGDNKDDPPREVESFIAQVTVLNGPIKTGYSLGIHCNTASTSCTFSELIERIDKYTGEVIEKSPTCLRNGDMGIVKIVPKQKLVAETLGEFLRAGLFVIRSRKLTFAIGFIKSVEKKA